MARKQQMKAIKDKNVNYLNCPDHLSILLLLLLLMLGGSGVGNFMVEKVQCISIVLGVLNVAFTVFL